MRRPSQPALKPKAKRQADEGERTRPPIPEIDGRIAQAVDEACRLNRYTQAEMGRRMGMSRDAYGKRKRAEVSWLVSELIAAAKAVGVLPAELLIVAGLSDEPGISPEVVIARDPRLNPKRGRDPSWCPPVGVGERVS